MIVIFIIYVINMTISNMDIERQTLSSTEKNTFTIHYRT